MRCRPCATRSVTDVVVAFAMLLAAMSFSACGTDDTVETTYSEWAVLTGRSNEFSAYTDSAVAEGRDVLVVSGLIGDMSGLSDGVDYLLREPPSAGRVTLVPRVNMNAIRLGLRAPGGDMNTMFGPSAAPAYRDAVTALQLIADSVDVLLVVTDQTEDVGHTIFYGEEAPAATMKLARDIADRVNDALPVLRHRTGIDFDDIYALRSDATGSLAGWASARRKPSPALELALFGGRDGSPPTDQQVAFARIAVVAAMVEIGLLDDEAIDRALASVSTGPAPATVAPDASALAFPEGSGLRYMLDGAPRVHVPGDLLSLPSDGVFQLVGLTGQRFNGVTVDILGFGDKDDIGETLALGSIRAGDYLLELTYRRDTTVIWRELAMVGDEVEGRLILQDSLGTNPWISSFPAPETWLYLNAGAPVEGITACASCDIPNTVRLVREMDRAVHGAETLIRSYRLVLDAAGIGRMFSTKWRPIDRVDHVDGADSVGDIGGVELVDIADLSDERGLNPGIAVDMRYATSDNFLGENVYDSMNRCLLERGVAEALIRVQKLLQNRGLGLKVYDCLRPHAVQYRMWELRPEPGYVAPPEPGSNHNRGAAVDLALVDARGVNLDMPTAFDSFTKRAWHDATDGISPEQIGNRNLLRDAMQSQGFGSIRKEWWHYNGPGFERFDRNLDVRLDAGYGRMQFPAEWRP